MHSSLPNSLNIHIIAVISAILLHVAISSWAIQPSDIIIIPDQQVVKISLVAPSTKEKVVIKGKDKIEKKEKQQVINNKKQGLLKQLEEEKALENKDQTIKPSTQKITSGIEDKNSLDISSAITKPIAAEYLNNPEPHYPLRARKKGLQGTVLLDVIINKDGNAKLVTLAKSSGYELLDQTALQTVMRWKFVPARIGNKTIEANVEVPITFRIN